MSTPDNRGGRAWLGWAPVVAVAGGMLLAGAPEGLSWRGWCTAAVFAATIVSFISRPLPMGPMVLVGLVVLLVVGAFGRGDEAVKELLAGYADSTVWLVVAAFLLSGTVVRTGFGRRIALVLISKFGRSTLGLGYAITGTELVLGPVIPSVTARGGGVMAPIVNSLARALGSTPENERRRTGAYLVLVGAHANLIAAAMFLTGMAANPQLRMAALDVFGVQWDWATWLQGSWLPALVGMALLPLFLHRLSPPDDISVHAAHQEAVAELRAMGPWTPRQLALGALLAAMIAGWATESLHGLHSTGVALIGVTAILALGIDDWTSFTGDRAAWDALIWLGGLVAMAERLKTEGVVEWFSAHMSGWVGGYSGVAAAIVLALIYFFSMYGFSMLTGHVVALSAGFFVVGQAAGTPPLLMVALISYFSNLCGCLTNYSTGPVVIYFQLGYVTPRRWFALGLAVAGFHLAVWLGVGLPYWRMLGWW